MLLGIMHTTVVAQNFRVNSPAMSSANYRSASVTSYSSNAYTPVASHTECYKAISHSMPSMSQPSTCSTVLSSHDDYSPYSAPTNRYGAPSGPRRVSEDDHNADPFMPVGDTPWIILTILACGYIAYIAYRRRKRIE